MVYPNEIYAKGSEFHKFITGFFENISTSCDEERIFRIHASHLDLDGYGCQVVMETAANVLRSWAPGHTSAEILYVNAKNPQELPSKIEEAIRTLTTLNGYRITIDRLYILVTDLSIDPAFFEDLMYEGHSVVYAVVDHHQDHNGYEKQWQNTDEEDDIDFTHNLVFARDGYETACFYGVDTTDCATLILAKMINNYASYAYEDDRDNVTLLFFIADIILYAESVNLWDTAKWGKWVVDNFQEVAPEIIENYTRWCFSGPDYRRLRSSMLELDISPIECPGILLHVKRSWIESKSDYEVFMEGCTYEDGVLSYKVKNGQHFNSTTLISREVLVGKYKDARYMQVIFPDGRVELRSGENGEDVSVIAHKHGGGGHVHAAGYMMATDPTRAGTSL